jgi:hypothetical protein
MRKYLYVICFFFLYFKAKEITIDKFFLEREGVCDG